jgi:uncharacterized protein YaeQ
MTLKATIYKVKLNISDLDRNYYDQHEITVARHPSETEQRMMVRILAFAMFASPNLSFTKGLCVDDEPELWARNLSDEIDLWISLGQIEVKQIRKAIGRCQQVVIITYAGNKSLTWYEQNKLELIGLKNLQVINIKPAYVELLKELAARNMNLQCTIQDGLVWLSNEETTVSIEPELLM